MHVHRARKIIDFMSLSLRGRRERRGKEHSRIPPPLLYSWFLQKGLLINSLHTYPLICLKRASCYCAIQRKPFSVALMVDSEYLQHSLHRFPAICRSGLCYNLVNFFSQVYPVIYLISVSFLRVRGGMEIHMEPP